MQDKDRLIIYGGERLSGTFEVHGAKNAVLPLLAASLLADDETVVEGCPHISDVSAMLGLIEQLGVEVSCDDRRVILRGRAQNLNISPYLSSLIRSSMFIMGALLATAGEVRLPLPGGCNIGLRPLDIHIDGFKKMGAEICCDGDALVCKAKKLRGAHILLRYPSVGATENLMMCAVLAEGETTLVNCAREPEVSVLAKSLRKMGAKIRGEGSSVIKIEGVSKLHGAALNPEGDRIEAGTVLSAAAICGGDVTVYGISDKILRSTLAALSAIGCDISVDGVGIRLKSNGELRPASIIAAPYPLIPTDMQPQLAACLCVAQGKSKVIETVFENRFAYARQLNKMGADISINKNVAYINGVKGLRGDVVSACDLRGGAALAIAAMAAEGKTVLQNAGYISRGYENFAASFGALGANIAFERANF